MEYLLTKQNSLIKFTLDKSLLLTLYHKFICGILNDINNESKHIRVPGFILRAQYWIAFESFCSPSVIKFPFILNETLHSGSVSN